MKLQNLLEKVYPTIRELQGQQIPVNVGGNKMFLRFGSGMSGTFVAMLTTGQAGRKNQQKVLTGIGPDRTLETVIDHINKTSQETGRPQIKLGH